MKTIYTSLFLLCFGNLSAQSYIPMPDSNAVWIEASSLIMAYNGHELATVTNPLYFGNDSVIGGETYHSLHGQSIAEWIDGWGSPQNYQTGTDYWPSELRVLFRQDIPNKLVYQWDNNGGQEQVLYDFANLVVGQPYPQTLNNWSYPQLLVMAYDSVLLLDGLYHEKWVLGSNSNDSGFVSVIEGVGSTMGFELPITLPFEQTSATLCFKKDGAQVYDGWNVNWVIQPEFSSECEANLSVAEAERAFKVSVWPVPTSSSLSVESDQPVERWVLYDMYGNVLVDRTIEESHIFEVSLGDFPEGQYLIRLNGERGTITKRIVRVK